MVFSERSAQLTIDFDAYMKYAPMMNDVFVHMQRGLNTIVNKVWWKFYINTKNNNNLQFSNITASRIIILNIFPTKISLELTLWTSDVKETISYQLNPANYNSIFISISDFIWEKLSS